MPTYRIVVSDPKTKKAVQKEFEEPQQAFIGKKIGENVQADGIGLAGYELEVRGGSDKEGFPMRKDVDGQSRKRLVLSGPPGFNPDRKGKRKRKSVRGNTVSADIVQINTKVVKHGQKSVAELWGIKPKEKPKPEKKEQTPEAEPKAEKEAVLEKKEEKPADKKPAEKKEQTPEAEKEAVLEKKEEKPADKKPAEKKEAA